MMQFSLWCFTTFITLGITEAVIKPIAKKWMQRRLLAAAPRIFTQVDRLLPQLLSECETPAALESRVRGLFETATGEDWSQASLEPFFEVYDLRKAVANYRNGP